MKKIGAFIITVCFFVLLACVPYLIGVTAYPGYLEAPLNLPLNLLGVWFSGVAIIIITSGMVATVVVLFSTVYILVLDVFN